MAGKLSNRGITAGMLGLIIAIVVVVLSLAIVFIVYSGVSKTITGIGTVAGSAQIVGTQGLTVTLTASGGKAVITQVNIIGTGGNIIMKLPGSLPSGCTLAIYNDTGQYSAWGTQVIPAGKSITINLFGTCGLASASEVQVVYENGKTTMIPVSS